mgnify:CR=1 FL=1
MKPKTAADVRAFLQNRAAARPKAAVPAVAIDGAKATLRLFDPIDSWGEWWGMSAKEFASALDELPALSRESPLLRSGLAFAGANRKGEARASGILTALEATPGAPLSGSTPALNVIATLGRMDLNQLLDVAIARLRVLNASNSNAPPTPSRATSAPACSVSPCMTTGAASVAIAASASPADPL